jgi:hypothetical protein
MTQQAQLMEPRIQAAVAVVESMSPVHMAELAVLEL